MDTLLEQQQQTGSGLTLSGGRVLGPDGVFSEGDLHFDAGVIAAAPPSLLGSCQSSLGAWPKQDVSDCLVLPGIIDVHGDGHERHLMPRAGADFPEWVALRNVDRELIANGITTAYLAQSYS